jgi:predicted RNA-binding Zn-ribbon protein involved in translation (DUF1610 family)
MVNDFSNEATLSERRLRRVGWAFVVLAFLVTTFFVISLFAELRVQRLSPSTPGAFGESGWWLRYVTVYRGGFNYESYGFLGPVGALPGSIPVQYRNGPCVVTWIGYNGIDTAAYSENHRTRWGFPLWPLPVAPAACGLWFWRRAASLRTRRRSRLCSRCGYDLRASTHRCPECGLAIIERSLPRGCTHPPFPRVV